jgi:hypothetical protein
MTQLVSAARSQWLEPEVSGTARAPEAAYLEELAPGPAGATNIALWSEQLDHVPQWDILAVGDTVTPNTQNGADGTLTADQVNLPNSVTSGIFQNIAGVTNPGDEYTLSGYVKGTPGQTMAIQLYDDMTGYTGGA